MRKQTNSIHGPNVFIPQWLSTDDYNKLPGTFSTFQFYTYNGTKVTFDVAIS